MEAEIRKTESRHQQMQESLATTQRQHITALQNRPETKENKKDHVLVIPYVEGLSHQIRRICSKFNVKTYFKPHQTIKKLLVKPKDKIDNQKKPGPIYKMKCGDCQKIYIGESKRMIEVRRHEHQKSLEKLIRGVIDGGAAEATAEHSFEREHDIKWDATTTLTFEPRQKQREIKEAIYIQTTADQIMNRNIGKVTIFPGFLDLLKRQPNKRF